ncbi:MAG TPA: alanyl-tRNA editing protein [Candidatus Babeliales bacterium]|jgi:Ser-tRNA(Ala) deacylase AlaX|nr:alanyl-tRNA editing protein [Candidatus Babeliales bacterium]
MKFLSDEIKNMRKVFWDDPYQHSLNTIVAAVDGNTIVCAETIAYSFSGGQESDKAYINGMPIVDSKIEGNLILYRLAEGHGLRVGDKVIMTIDWPRRYRLMRLHFAAELILEIVTKNYHLQKVGAHIAEHKARIDFKSDSTISTLFPAILAEYNAIIASDKVIETGYSDVINQRRFWKIDGFAQVPCGGTHVKLTAEVGFVTLKREHPGKSIERIEIRLVE